MGVIFKHTFKNMFSKPFRTLMLILCILICSFAGMMTFDMTNSITNILHSAYNSMVGTSNIVVTSKYALKESDFEGLPEHEKIFIAGTNSKYFLRNNTMYEYYNEKNISVLGADMNKVKDMQLLAAPIELSDSETAIPKELAEELNLKIGDTLTLNDKNGNPVEYTVKSIQTYKGLLSSKYTAVLSVEGIAKLGDGADVNYYEAMVRVFDEDKTEEFCQQLEGKLRGITTDDLIRGENTMQQINQITSVFVILFTVCLLLVIFVTISLSERIMVERMGTVGTLRSLGVSPNATAMIVLCENALYGLIGGVLGAVLYIFTRDPIFNNVFTLNSGSDIELEMNLGSVSTVATIGVVLGAIIIECLCPIKELLKATRTSIRDLIFDNKDTEFKYTRRSMVAAILFTLIAIVSLTMLFTGSENNILLILLSIFSSVPALFIGYPFLLRGISVLIEKLFRKMNCPVAAFACVQARTKKATVGISRLFVMALAIGLALFMASESYTTLVNHREANCDVIVEELSEEASMYQYFADLDGVSDVEFFYRHWSVNFVIGADKIAEFEALTDSRKMREMYEISELIGTDGQYRLCDLVRDLPKVVKDDEIYMSETMAKRLGYKKGDSIEILIAADSFLPVHKTLKLADYCDTHFVTSTDSALIVSLNTYKEAFYDYPECAYINTSDPQGTIEKIKSYSSSVIGNCRTMDDYMEYVKQMNAGITTILYMLITMGVILTFIGVVSNQVIGFSGRKRECAVLLSTAMSRGKLKSAFFSENTLSCIVALFFAIPFAFVSCFLILRAMKAIDMIMEFSPNPGNTVLFIGGMFLIFAATALLPVKYTRKMKIAEQLKYE